MKRVMRLLYILPLSLFSILTILFFASLKGPVFTLREIKVEGVKSIREKEIMEAISPFINRELFGIDEEQIRKILALNPFVKDVKVKKLYPFSLIIDIEEKRSSALWVRPEGDVMILDEEGRPYSNLRNGDVNGLVLINASNEKEAKEVFEKIDHWIKQGIIRKEDIMEVSYTNGEITVFYREDTEIFLGKKDFEKRLQNAISIYEDARKRGLILRYIDANFDEKLEITREKKTE